MSTGPSHRDMSTMTVPERPEGLSDRPRAMGFGPGDRVGRYVVEAELGRGGMGVVFAATDPSLQRRIALRVVRPDESDPLAGERMMREARAVAALAHPNVVAMHDVGSLDDGQIFLAMELVEGRTLRAIMREGGSTSGMLDFFLQAGRGLAAAHDAGLVHRDFRPDNVLVGTDGRARVTDFGLVRGESESSPVASARPKTLTASGVILGTPAYMAPEQHIGAPASPESDQFAFAVSLFEMLAGERPFQGTYDEMQAAKLGAGHMPWPAQKHLPPALTSAIDRALQRDPKTRYPSMREFVAALEVAPRAESARHMTGPPTAMSAPMAPGAYPQYPNTRPPPPIQMVAPPPKPDRSFLVPAIVGGVFLVLAVFAVVVGSIFGTKKTTTTTPPKPANDVERLAMPGPQPPPPAFVPFVASLTPTSKLPCPAGATQHHEDGATYKIFCADKSNRKQGPYVEFASHLESRLVAHCTYLHDQLDGREWAFTNGMPSVMQEFKNGVPNGEMITLGSNGRVAARAHFLNGVQDGMDEKWVALTGDPVSARRWKNGQLVGSSN